MMDLPARCGVGAEVEQQLLVDGGGSSHNGKSSTNGRRMNGAIITYSIAFSLCCNILSTLNFVTYQTAIQEYQYK